MRFLPSKIPGVFVIEQEQRVDDRGFFARAFCRDEFEKAGIEHEFAQINNSLTAKRGTLRGFHYQVEPSAEVKVVRCIQGALFDVAADLRPDSPTFGQWFGAELTAANRRCMVVPRGCAHAFLTLTDDVEALYMVSAPYAPACERGLRFDDPFLSVDWPFQPLEMSEKDASWPPFEPPARPAPAAGRPGLVLVRSS